MAKHMTDEQIFEAAWDEMDVSRVIVTHYLKDSDSAFNKEQIIDALAPLHGNDRAEAAKVLEMIRADLGK